MGRSRPRIALETRPPTITEAWPQTTATAIQRASCDRGETALSAPARGRLLCSSSGSDAGSGSDLDVATSGVDPITTDDDFVIELLAQEQQTEAESAAEVEVDAGGANALACVSVSDGDGDGDLDLISF